MFRRDGPRNLRAACRGWLSPKGRGIMGQGGMSVLPLVTTFGAPAGDGGFHKGAGITGGGGGGEVSSCAPRGNPWGADGGFSLPKKCKVRGDGLCRCAGGCTLWGPCVGWPSPKVRGIMGRRGTLPLGACAPNLWGASEGW